MTVSRFLFLLVIVSLPSAILADAPVKEIKTFSESPRNESLNPIMSEIASIGRQIARFQKQNADLNRSIFDAGVRSQKIFMQSAELRFSNASRVLKQAEFEIQASRLEAEALDLDKKMSESRSQAVQNLRAEMAEKSAGLRLKATKTRAQAGALAIENSEAQVKIDRMSNEAHRESVMAANVRVQVVENERKMLQLEQKMQDLAIQSQAASGNQKVR